MKTISITTAFLFIASVSCAQQAKFVTSGTIEYEKTVNMYAVIKNNISDDNTFSKLAFEAYQKSNPQFKKFKSTLIFSGNKGLYTPVVTSDETKKMGDAYAGQINTTYSDFDTHATVIEKVVYGESFLVKDSLRKIKWKITDETREIAGYTCRRANGLIMDSVYVVAFYCNKIPVFGGPESFTGLPGMIMGVVMPHENMNWFATRVTDTQVAATAILPPKKGKPVNRKQLYQALKAVLENGGKSWSYVLKLFLL